MPGQRALEFAPSQRQENRPEVSTFGKAHLTAVHDNCECGTQALKQAQQDWQVIAAAGRQNRISCHQPPFQSCLVRKAVTSHHFMRSAGGPSRCPDPAKSRTEHWTEQQHAGLRHPPRHSMLTWPKVRLGVVAELLKEGH